MLLDYAVKAAGPVRVTVADKSGTVIRTINSRAEAGVNRFALDLFGAGEGARGGSEQRQEQCAATNPAQPRLFHRLNHNQLSSGRAREPPARSVVKAAYLPSSMATRKPHSRSPSRKRRW